MIQELITNKIKYGFFDKTFDTSHHYYTHKNLEQPSCPIQIVEDNCRKVAKEMESDGLAVLRQVHGNDVYFATSHTQYGLEPIADAQVTNVHGLVIGIQTADCVPVLFACRSGEIVGAAHCGWKSAKLNIVRSVVLMMKELGAEDIVAIIGPSIQQNSYEVDKVYYDNFVQDDKESSSFFKNGKDGYFFFDLPGYVERKLNNEGIVEIERYNDDTYEMESKYYSWRRCCHKNEPYDGNLLSTIVIM